MRKRLDFTLNIPTLLSAAAILFSAGRASQRLDSVQAETANLSQRLEVFDSSNRREHESFRASLKP